MMDDDSKPREVGSNLGLGAWVSCAERLPAIPADAPKYASGVDVLAFVPGQPVCAMRFARNPYAKTEKGRAPRWEEYGGNRLAWQTPTHWMPLPAPPQSA